MTAAATAHHGKREIISANRYSPIGPCSRKEKRIKLTRKTDVRILETQPKNNNNDPKT
jgi:hypothetical protein